MALLKSRKIIHRLLKINIHIHNEIIPFIKRLIEAHNRKTSYIKQLKIDKTKSLIDVTPNHSQFWEYLTPFMMGHRGSVLSCSVRTYKSTICRD